MMMMRRRWRGREGMRRISRTAWWCKGLLLQGFFQQEEVEKQHRIDTQRPNFMNYLLTPEALYHLPLATLSCLPKHYILLNTGVLKSNSSIFPRSEGYITQYTP